MIRNTSARLLFLGLLVSLVAPMRASATDVTYAEVEGFFVPKWAKPAPAAVAANQPLHITFAMQPYKGAQLDAFLASQRDPKSPNYHHWLTPDQVGERFGTSDADIASVVTYAQQQGFRVTHVWPNKLFVSADTTVAQAERAFQIKVNSYVMPPAMTQTGETTFFAPDHRPLLPVGLASKIYAVHGLGHFPALRHHASPHMPALLPALRSPLRPAGGGGNPLEPADVSKVWNFDALHKAGFTGKGDAIDIWSPTNFTRSVVDHFASHFNLTGYTILETKVDGGATDSGGEDEADLDGEMIVGQAYNCTMNYVEGPNDIETSVDIWNQVGVDNPPVASCSWGYWELDIDQNNLKPADMSVSNELAVLAAQGISVFSATGDFGSSDANNQTTANYPSTDPNVTAVGGTALTVSSSGGWGSETGWSDSGGGVSIWFNTPSWQSGPGVPQNAFRQIPDVSLLADDLNPGYLTWLLVNGQTGWYLGGGTSASTPQWAAATLLIDEMGKQRYGLLNPMLYQFATQFNDPSQFYIFHDITSGNNGAFSCTPNYDLVTGIGSADFGKLAVNLTQLPDYTPYNPGSGGPGGAWTSPVMIDTSATAVGEPSSFNDSTTYYFAIAIQDLGPADAPGSTADIQIDGVDHLVTLGPAVVGGYVYTTDGLTTKLTGGSHTIKLIANSNSAIKEGSSSNNTYTRTITVTSSTPVLSGVSETLSSVNGGVSDAGTVSLNKNASTNTVVNLSSSNTAVLQVPGSVTINANQSKVSYTATTATVTTATTVTVTATLNGVSKTTSVTVGPAPKLSTVKISPNVVAGGVNTTGTVNLSGNTYSPLTVNLTSGNTSLFTVPASVTVPSGSSSVTFTVTTIPVSANAAAKVTATLGTASTTASLEVTAPALVSVTANPSSVQGGQAATGTVTLGSAAPSAGMTVTLSSSSGSATVPSSVTVASGATTATFNITTKPVTSSVTVTLSAMIGSTKVKGTLTVTTPPSITNLSLAPSKVYGGLTSTGTVVLKSNVPIDTVVALSSTNSSVAKPQATVTVPAGSNSATFTVNAFAVATSTQLSIVAKLGAGSYAATFEVWAPNIASVTFNPTSVHGGQSTTGTVTLTGPAPTGGTKVTFKSSTGSATPVGSVTVAAGKTSATFNVNTSAVTATVTAKITGTVAGGSVSGNFTINP